MQAADVTLVMVHEEQDPYRKALLAEIVTLSLVHAHDVASYTEAVVNDSSHDRMWWAGAKTADELSLTRLVRQLNEADHVVGAQVVA